jgi:hypothetical protein
MKEFPSGLNVKIYQIIVLPKLYSFVVVEECVRLLVAGGFTELKEKDTWRIQPLGKVQ